METQTTLKKANTKLETFEFLDRRFRSAGTRRIAEIVQKHFINQANIILKNLSGLRKADQFLQRQLITLSTDGLLEESLDFADELLDAEIQEGELFGQLNFRRATNNQMIGPTLEIFRKNQSEFLDRVLPEMVQGMEKTTRDTIRGVITRGIRDDKNTGEIVQELRDRFKTLGDQARTKTGRVFTIARTEMNRTHSFAIEESGILAGDSIKVWIWSGVERDFHATMNGQTVPLNGTFVSGLGNPTQGPGRFAIAREDINCRCIIQTRRAEPSIII